MRRVGCVDVDGAGDLALESTLDRWIGFKVASRRALRRRWRPALVPTPASHRLEGLLRAHRVATTRVPDILGPRFNQCGGVWECSGMEFGGS